MLRFLDIEKFTRGLSPIKSTELLTRSGDYSTDGLFSETIFGPEGSLQRRQTFSYIDLQTKVIHPSALRILYQLDARLKKFVSTEESFEIGADGRLVISEEGVTGIPELIKLFPKIKFRADTPQREKMIELMQKSYKDGTLFIDKIPVIPPDFRPAYQDVDRNWSFDPLNDVYLAVMRRAIQVRGTGAGPLFDLLINGLQKAVVAHDDYIRDRVKKKGGLIRKQLMGKRVDYSGRAAITPGPDLRINEVGLPLKLAVSLFEPFMIHHLLYTERIDKEELGNEIKDFTEMELSVDSIQRVFRSIKAGDVMPPKLYEIFHEAAEVAMTNRVVIIKRDPVLHTGSVRAMSPKLIQGDAMQLCTLQVGGFNADFDGDTMAVFHPLTNESQEEAKSKMMGSFTGETSTSLGFELSKEMCVGLYILTKTSKSTKPNISVSEEDLEKATNPYIPVLYRRRKTSMGKAIFNSCFPPDHPFVDDLVTKKVVGGIISKMSSKYDQEVVIETMSKLKTYGFKFATIFGPTMTLDNFDIPQEIQDLKSKLNDATLEEAQALIEKMKTILIKHLNNTGFHDLIESGAGKGWDQPTQILVAKGIIADPSGNIMEPIKGSFSEGLDNKEFFDNSYGARKGIVDRALNTADTGYLSRQLIYILNSVEASINTKDCKTTRTLDVKLNKNIMERITGRFIINKGKVEEFIPSEHNIGEVIKLRTPIFCRSPKICHTCYGRLLTRHQTPYIGVLAAQHIGERGTQLIMRTFHTGGAATIAERNMITDILDNDPLINSNTISSYLVQAGDFLNCKKACSITLDLTDYTIGDNITIEPGEVKVRNLLSRIEFEDLIFNLILDYNVVLPVQKMTKNEKISITLDYTSGSSILEAPMEAVEIKEQIHYLERLLGGREVFKDSSHLFRKILKIYSPPTTNMDTVHLEVLMSNCLRDKRDNQLPARLGKTWDPMMVNIKQIVFASGFIQGLAFENINKAITTGLISEKELEPSVLERVLTGALVKEREE